MEHVRCVQVRHLRPSEVHEKHFGPNWFQGHGTWRGRRLNSSLGTGFINIHIIRTLRNLLLNSSWYWFLILRHAPYMEDRHWILTSAVSRFPYGPQTMQTRLGSISEASRRHTQWGFHQAPRAAGAQKWIWIRLAVMAVVILRTSEYTKADR